MKNQMSARLARDSTVQLSEAIHECSEMFADVVERSATQATDCLAWLELPLLFMLAYRAEWMDSRRRRLTGIGLFR
jgi:hypothetical protein